MTTNAKMPKENVPTLPAEEAFTILEAPLIRLVRGKPGHKFAGASLTAYPLTAIGGQRHSRIIRVWGRRPYIGKRVALYYHAKVRLSIFIIILAILRPWESHNWVSFLVLTPSAYTSPEVELCGYSIPHPSEAKMNIRIQTYGSFYFVQHIWLL